MCELLKEVDVELGKCKLSKVVVLHEQTLTQD